MELSFGFVTSCGQTERLNVRTWYMQKYENSRFGCLVFPVCEETYFVSEAKPMSNKIVIRQQYVRIDFV